MNITFKDTPRLAAERFISDIDPMMAGMVLIRGKVMLGYKATPGDDFSHEETAGPLFCFASG